MKIDYVRESAIKILNEIENNNAYSNIVLDEYINKNRQKLKEKDISFLSELVYGVTMWRITLDSIIEMYSKIKLKKISCNIKNIMRIAIYQIIFLNKVPKSAAVNESVNLTKKYLHKSTGFVNAILRKVQKEDYNKLYEIKDNKIRISKVYSMPLWIVEKLFDEYDEKTVEQICKNSTLKPKITIRINYLNIAKDKFIEELNKNKIPYEETEMENFLHVKLKNIANTNLFQKGYFTIQDMSAGLASFILNPQEGEIVLDACSAPGGKTTYLAEQMKNKGEIIAWDIHENRLELVNQKAKQLGITIINTKVQDASKYNEEYKERFDKILLDVPCMGLGVIKKKPDIKWQKSKEEINTICKIQKEILNTCSKYIKIGGAIVYSTCSILKEENQNQIKEFLKDNSDFIYDYEKKILPNEKQDGFYICKLIRKK